MSHNQYYLLCWPLRNTKHSVLCDQGVGRVSLTETPLATPGANLASLSGHQPEGEKQVSRGSGVKLEVNICSEFTANGFMLNQKRWLKIISKYLLFCWSYSFEETVTKTGSGRCTITTAAHQCTGRALLNALMEDVVSDQQKQLLCSCDSHGKLLPPHSITKSSHCTSTATSIYFRYLFSL